VELIEGQTAKHLIRGRPLYVEEIRDLSIQVTRASAAAAATEPVSAPPSVQASAAVALGQRKSLAQVLTGWKFLQQFLHDLVQILYIFFLA
jgi:hypothetical protein